jgi:MAE_28990/MAE_18760-like HEPN
MTSLSDELADRREEFEAHFGLAEALQDRMMLDSVLGSISLSVRHLNTIKSGLIVHIYNIVEALMTRSLSHLGSALGSTDPRQWTENTFREWLRENIVNRTSEGNEEARLNVAFERSNSLLGQGALGPQSLKKPSGTWNDKLIALFMRRMSIRCDMPPEMWSRIAASTRYGEKTPLEFLADRRNAIAHGRRSFENGASDLDLQDIRKLADITLDYMGHTMTAVQRHVETGSYLVVAA